MNNISQHNSAEPDNNIKGLADHEKIAAFYINLIQESGMSNELKLKDLKIGMIYRADILRCFDPEDNSWQDFVTDPDHEIVVFRSDAVDAVKNSTLGKSGKNNLFSLIKQSGKSQEPAGRAHSYIYTMLEYLRRKKGDLVYREALGKLGLTEEDIEYTKQNPTGKNSYLLELAVLHQALHYFGDIGFAQQEKVIETVCTQTSTLELLPNKKGFIERKILPMFLMSKIVGKFSRGNSTISYGESYNLVNGREAGGLKGLFRRKQEAHIVFTYYNAPFFEHPWLKRPKEIVREGKVFSPSIKSVYGVGLVDYYSVIGAVAATIGAGKFKDITVNVFGDIETYPLCLDQWEVFFDGRQYIMKEDGAFFDKSGMKAVDSLGEPVSYFDVSTFALDENNNVIYGLNGDSLQEDTRVKRIIEINSKLLVIRFGYERRYKYGKFKIDIARDLGREADELGFFRDVVPAFFKRRFGTLSVIVVFTALYFAYERGVGLAVVGSIAAVYALLIGRLSDFLQKRGVRKERFYKAEIEDDRERDGILQENQMKLYNQLAGTSRKISEEQQKLDSILNSLTSGIVTLDMNNVIIDVNASFCSYMNTERGDLIGKIFRDMFNKDDYAKIEVLFEEVYRSKKGKFEELELEHIFENIVYIKTILSPILDEDGDIISITITFEDRTKQQVAEIKNRDQLQKESKINQKILMSVGDANPYIEGIIEDSKEFSGNLGKINDIVEANMENSQDFANSLTIIENMSSELVNFINLIVDISDRTNLISLNAAIEAARAGESGRAFAVVSGEISKLADQSKKGSEEQQRVIEKIIELLQKIQEKYGSINDRFMQLTALISKLLERAKGNEERAEKAQVAMKDIKGAIRDSIGL